MTRFAIPRQSRSRKRNLDPAYKEYYRKVGLSAEERFFSAVESGSMRFPEWMYVVRKATPEQNQSGVDVVVEIDCGVVYLNIKSSAAAASLFETRENRRTIPCLVIAQDHSEQTIVSNLCDVVGRERTKILSARR